MKGQVYTVAKFHYINGVVYHAASKGKTSLQVIAENYKQTTKSGNVKHPLERVGMLARLAKGVGLINISKDKVVELTELGKRYYKARLKDKWSLSKDQKDMMCEHLLSNPKRTATIYAITSLLNLYKKGLKNDELVQEYAKAIGKEDAWQSHR